MKLSKTFIWNPNVYEHRWGINTSVDNLINKSSQW